jgi:probable rRNA maturation factor
MIPIGAVDIENETEYDIDLDSLIHQTRFMFQQLRLHAETEVSILLVDEERMSQLHVEWMEEEGPTDVLSFPMDELVAPADDAHPEPGILGDIVLCPAFAERQAAAAGQSLEDELAMLLTHGILHCLGHDHVAPEEHAVMFALQHDLLKAWWALNE